MKTNDLAEFIVQCGCMTCRALTSLKRNAGAKVLISRHNTGRMCELAVVAAAGPVGLDAQAVVRRRRAYAKHLGVPLAGPIQDAEMPVHIDHAVDYSNHTTGDRKKQPIQLGSAHALREGGRYALVWDPELDLDQVRSHLARREQHMEDGGRTLCHGIAIAWPAGIERIEIDLDRLSEDTVIADTTQHIDEPLPNELNDYDYETSSTIVKQADGRYRIAITYESWANQHIPKNECWWGTTVLVMHETDREGTVQWNDRDYPEHNMVCTFHRASWNVSDTIAQVRDREEADLDGRTNLTPTQKRQMIKARRGQGVFRQRVLGKEASCRLTGTSDPAHLRASHIKPWASSSDAERLDGDNGLMLAPHVDHLFDKHLISFDNNGTLLVLNDEIGRLLADWGIKIDEPTIQPRAFNHRQCKFLAEHRKVHEQLCKEE